MHCMHTFSRSFEGDRCFCERVGWKCEWFYVRSFQLARTKTVPLKMPRTISEQHWPAKNGILPEVKAWSLKISETLGWRSAFNAQHFTPVLCGHMGK